MLVGKWGGPYSLLPLSFHWHGEGWWKGLPSLLVLGDGRISASPLGLPVDAILAGRGKDTLLLLSMWPPLSPWDGSAHYCLGGKANLNSPLGLLWHYPVGMSKPIIPSGREYKPKLPTQPLPRSRATVYLLCLAKVEHLLFKSLLSCQASPFLVLWIKRTGFSWGVFVVCAHWYFQVGGLFQFEHGM